MTPKELPEVVTHVQDLGNGKYYVFTNTPGDKGTTFACVHDIDYLWHLLEVMGRSAGVKPVKGQGWPEQPEEEPEKRPSMIRRLLKNAA